MYRLVSISIILVVMILASNREALADTLAAGEKQRNSELAELVQAYAELDTDSDKDLMVALNAHIQRIMDDERTRATAIQSALKWSKATSYITFVIAHVLLAFGLFASIMELRHSWKLRAKGGRESFEIELGLEKIALKSSMYGSLILVVSLAFYLMYLNFVYPVTYIS